MIYRSFLIQCSLKKLILIIIMKIETNSDFIRNVFWWNFWKKFFCKNNFEFNSFSNVFKINIFSWEKTEFRILLKFQENTIDCFCWSNCLNFSFKESVPSGILIWYKLCRLNLSESTVEWNFQSTIFTTSNESCEAMSIFLSPPNIYTNWSIYKQLPLFWSANDKYYHMTWANKLFLINRFGNFFLLSIAFPLNDWLSNCFITFE